MKYPRKTVEIWIVISIIIFYLFRTSVPLLKFPFILIYLLFLIYIVFNDFKESFSRAKVLIRDYYLLLMLFSILLFAFFHSNKMYLSAFKDVINSIILISIGFVLSLIISSRSELKFFVINFTKVIFVFALLCSVIGLLDLFNIVTLNDYFLIKESPGFNSDDSLYIDWNFATIPSFFGIASIIYLSLKKVSFTVKIIQVISFLIFSLNIIFSGSRRGIILLFVFYFIISCSLIYLWFNKYYKNINLRWILFYFLFSNILLIVLLFIFFNYSNYLFKNNFIELIGTKNIGVTKTEITHKIFRYFSVVNKRLSYSQLYNKIWSVEFNPKDPDSGWGSRVHKRVYPLSGQNVEIVPEGTIGYLMDKTTEPFYYETVDLCESFTLLTELNTKIGERYKASVYCFVSEDFKIDNASLVIGSSTINNNIVRGKTISSYDLSKKGTWQYLEIDFDCNDGEVPIFLSFFKHNTRDFSNLEGHIIFAYPIYGKLDDSTLIFYQSYFKIGRSSPAYTSGLPNLSKMSFTNFQNIFNPAFSTILVLNDNDVIRNFVRKMVSEDTTYYPFKNCLLLNSGFNSFVNDRVIRWKFALNLFSKEYNLTQKLFGGGFNFLNWYGYYFLKDKTASDWPHNPFLSILLYSGVFGLLIYCFFLYKVFYYYIKYIKEYPLLFIFFLITFFFNFFSGGSPFDHPIMGFFSILPFFIHSVHKREKEKELALSKSEDTAS